MSQAVQTRADPFAPVVERVRREVARDATPLSRIREAALARLDERGLPGNTESFRFTELHRLDGLDLQTAGGAPAGLELPEDLASLAGADAGLARLVFVNGFFRRDLSHLPELPEGVVAGGLAEQDPALLAEHLGSTEDACAIPEVENGFARLNAAGFADGGFLHVPAGVVLERPVYLVHLAAGEGEGAALAQPRSLIVAGRGSRAPVVEVHARPKGRTLTNAVTEVLAAENSRVDLTKVQAPNPEGYHLATTRVRQARDSRLFHQAAQRGGPLVRNDLTVVLEGEGAECSLKGAFLIDGQDLVDNHVWVDHASPHAGSDQLYKGLAGGKSRGVFDGQILVREGAEKTSAHQQNRNLLLSDDALVHSNPRLRIHNDDVKCSHGSTLGQLDREALFYLRTRGLPEARARALLTYAFVADLLDAVSFDPLREWLGPFLRAGLPGGEGGAA